MTSTDAPAEQPAQQPLPPAPRLSRLREGSYGKILLEVALITLGVFLALMADQWRERAEHRELAEDTVRRFRAEFQTNRKAVAGVIDKHVQALATIQAYFNADAAARSKMDYPFFPTDPAFLEYTAWDLAIATQALSYVEPDLAQAVAHVYAVQRQLDNSTKDITLVMYDRAGEADPVPFTRSLATYFGDCGLHEPRLLKLYDEILPRLDARLGPSK